MRAPALAVAALAIALALSIALFGHHPTLSLQQLERNCELRPFVSNHVRVRACKAILKRDIKPEYRGAINTQLCVALVKADSWKKAVEACTAGNSPHEQIANYLNLGVAHFKLGNMYAALQSLDRAAELDPRLEPKLD